MDHQGFVRDSRSANMGAKPFALPFEIASQAEIIQPGFTNCDDFG